MDIVFENNVKREEQEGKASKVIYYRNFYDVLKTSPRKWTIDNIRAHCWKMVFFFSFLGGEQETRQTHRSYIDKTLLYRGVTTEGNIVLWHLEQLLDPIEHPAALCSLHNAGKTLRNRTSKNLLPKIWCICRNT